MMMEIDPATFFEFIRIIKDHPSIHNPLLTNRVSTTNCMSNMSKHHEHENESWMAQRSITQELQDGCPEAIHGSEKGNRRKTKRKRNCKNGALYKDT
jgi:hypothetical protein